MSEPLKILVTHGKALQRKYGDDGLKKIHAAIDRLVVSDRNRGLRTILVRLDDAKDMKKYGQPMKTPVDRRGAKRTIDAICTKDRPDYVVLLGGPDVIPFQHLTNPLKDEPFDLDPFTLSDLPYACNAPYSTETEKFVGPSRVVGRIPDLKGASDPELMIAMIDRAAGWKSRPAADYANCFAVSAQIWQGSTKKSLTAIFGKAGTFFRSPKSGPTWKSAQLAPRMHFINCHGDVASPAFYGEDESGEKPCAHHSSKLAGLVSEGAVIAAECCYGGELYDLTLTDGEEPICTTYLREGAYAMFSSTTVAYGEADETTSADLICQSFMQAILAGASSGRATLEARQRFIETNGGELGPEDVKTLGQFYLLGDPSIHPVKSKKSATPKVMTAVAKVSPMAATGIATAKARREVLHERGETLGRTTRAVRSHHLEADPKMKTMMRAMAKSYGEPIGPVTTFSLGPSKSKSLGIAGKGRREFCVIPIKSPSPKESVPSRAKHAPEFPPLERRRPVLVIALVEGGHVLRSKRVFGR